MPLRLSMLCHPKPCEAPRLLAHCRRRCEKNQNSSQQDVKVQRTAKRKPSLFLRPWRNSRPCRKHRSRYSVRRPHVDGGVAIRQGLDEDVIDDVTILTVPVVVGTGRRLSGRQLGASTPNCLACEAGAETLPLWEQKWPGPAMKLVGPPPIASVEGGPLAARSPISRRACHVPSGSVACSCP